MCMRFLLYDMDDQGSDKKQVKARVVNVIDSGKTVQVGN